ncbi:MAG: hypothetical protein FWC20_05105 [Oscillospiraceae bacterium]|nr:hypothetical protein [Oscillospiraceae bacterium]MCL2278769.1 hypothetical protein [Oscillospiraceae bacterium]
MSKLVLGVDGGATKSHLALFDESGKCVAATVYGALNHEVMKGSFDELREKLAECVAIVLEKAGAKTEDVTYAVLGLAGVDTESQQERITGIVGETGLKNYLVCNDALLGVPAGCPDCVGICAINGTGFKLAAVDKSGSPLHTCGVGPLTDDCGGGTWYGQRAIGVVYNELYKLGKPTMMRDMLYKLAGVSRREDYLDTVADKYMEGSFDLVSLNSIPFEAAAKGDEVALSILSESAEQYAGGIARLAIEMEFPKEDTLHVTLAGSVFVKQKVKILQDMIQNRIADALGNRDVKYTNLDAPPVAGAVVWASQKSGIKPDMEKIKAELKKAGL